MINALKPSSAFILNPGQQRAMTETLTTSARFLLLYGGSRSGKTAQIVSIIIDRALNSAGSRHLIVRKEGSAAKRSVAMDTFPKIWALKYPNLPCPKFKSHDGGYFELSNGSQIWVGGLNDEKAMERILGNEYASIYINEASEVAYAAFVLLRSRLAQVCTTLSGAGLKQRFYVDLNPTTTAHWTYQLWIMGIEPQDKRPIDKEKYKYSIVNPDDNRSNLSKEYLDDLDVLPERQRQRFKEGKYTADDDDALWKREHIKYADVLPEMKRVIVSVDPAVSNNIGSDETGIMVMGLGVDNRGYLLADESGKYTPSQWARRAIAAFHTYNADRIVAEVNQGGDLVEANIKAHQHVNEIIPYTGVHATKAKVVRAEPTASRYQMGQILHAEPFPDLEDQMCSFTIGFDRKKQGYSPDRVDALVWGATLLFPPMVNRSNNDDIEDIPIIVNDMSF